MRVGIAALLQESNTFVRAPTTIERFEEDVLLEGEAIRARFAGASHEIGGFLEGLGRAGIEAAPVFAARAIPAGAMTAETLAALLDRLAAALGRAGRLDGLLAAAHGATACETERDVDGLWLSMLRERAGPGVPIIATLDPHANLSPRMAAAADALIAYRTNPHLDQRERGLEAAALMARALRGEVRPVAAAAFPPLAIGIERQDTASEPLASLCRLAVEIGRRPGALSASLLLGFPYADVEEMGSAAVAAADGDRALAQRLASELAEAMWSRRRELRGPFLGIEEALGCAAALAGPICLLDIGDNVGGGSPGDGTHLINAIRRRGLGPAFACLCDPEAAARAAAAGAGARLRLAAGGKLDSRLGAPLEDEFTVLFLHDGRFEEPEARHGGFTVFDQGTTAVVRTDGGLTLMLASRRAPPFSLRQLTALGVEPAAFRLIVAKGVHAPVAAYAPVCRHFLRVDAPGVTPADMTRLPHRHRRQPMFPFEPETAWRP